MANPINRRITKLFGQQLLLLGIVFALLWWHQPQSAYSALLAGMIYWLPNAYFMLCVFRYKGVQSATLVVRSAYQGETGKFLLTVVGFALAFILIPTLDVFALFAVYFGLIVSQWLLISHW